MPELMKGHVWGDFKHKMQYPCIAEVKYDEIRCHVKVQPDSVQYLSYAGKPLANMNYFDRWFELLAVNTGLLEFDMGFEVNANFNDSYRWVRSTKGLPTDLLPAVVRFVWFDIPQELQRTYASRSLLIEEYLVGFPYNIQAPMKFECYSEADVEAAYKQAREAGYEGLMVKSLQHKYQRGKRVYDWLKMKPENDADGVIIGFEEAVCGKDQPERGLKAGDLLGRVGSVLVQCEDGSQASPHGINHELGQDMYLHPEKYLGQWCEFKYMERDRQGGYRHPTFNRIREEKQ